MPGETIDSLNIKITANANTAGSAINKLSQSLRDLQNVTKGVNTSGLDSISQSVGRFASAMTTLANVKKPDYNRLTKGIEQIAGIDAKNLASAGGAIGKLVTPINDISQLNFNQQGLTSFITALRRFADSSQAINNVDFSSLGSGITGLANQLQTTATVSTNIIQFTNSIGKIASAGNNMTVVSGELKNFGLKYKEFIQDMKGASQVSSETIAFTDAIGRLAGVGNRTKSTADNLEHLGNELKKFFQTMSSAPKVSQEIIQMTQALAQLSSQSSGLSRATSVLGNVSSSMKNIFSNVGKNSSGATSKIGSLASAIGKLYAKYWLLLRAISGVRGWVDLASSLTEVQNVVDVSFGGMASKVDEFTKTSIQDFGMSELSAKQYASRFQAMGSAMGITSNQIASANKNLNETMRGFDANDPSKSYVEMSDSLADVSLNLTKLTADMASFYNVEQSTVAEALQSGVFGGNTRPLRAYGLDLSQATLAEWAMKNGLDANIKSMTQAEKTMLRYQYVMSNMKGTAGDFARTSDKLLCVA